MRRLIGHKWTQFETNVLPVEMTELQRITLQETFYAGAWALFNVIKESNLDADEAAMKLHDDLVDEFEAFWINSASREH